MIDTRGKRAINRDKVQVVANPWEERREGLGKGRQTVATGAERRLGERGGGA